MGKIEKPYSLYKKTKTGGREFIKDFDTEQQAINFKTQREVTDPGEYFIETPDAYNSEKAKKINKHWYFG